MARIVLLLLVAVVGCQKSATSEPTPPQKEAPQPRAPYEDGEEKALAHAEKLGAKVVRKKEGGPGDPPITVDLSGKAVTDADLKGFAGFRNLTRLNLSGTAVGAAGLKELAGVYSLAHLDLSKCPNVNDAAAKELGKFEGLSTLVLAGTAVTDAGLKELAPAAALASLDVSQTKVTDAGVAELQKALPRCKVKK
jgi:hypothetical protein